MTPLAVGLVGAGMMGSNHARTIASSPRTALAVVMDVERERATSLAAMYGAAWTSSIDSLRGVDAVVVASPAEHHFDAVCGLISQGTPVLVEKPAAVDPEQVRSMVEAARFSGVPFQVGFVERYNPVIRAARDYMAHFGTPIHFSATRHSPPNPRIQTSVVHDLLIHDLDLGLQVMGGPGHVAVGSTTWSPGEGKPIEIADATATLANGAVMTLSASRMSQRKIRDIRIALETALLELDLLRRTMTVYQHIADAPGFDRAGYQSNTLVDIPFVRQEGEPLAIQWDSFCDLVEGRRDAEAELAGIHAPHSLAAEVESSEAVLSAAV